MLQAPGSMAPCTQGSTSVWRLDRRSSRLEGDLFCSHLGLVLDAPRVARARVAPPLFARRSAGDMASSQRFGGFPPDAPHWWCQCGAWNLERHPSSGERIESCGKCRTWRWQPWAVQDAMQKQVDAAVQMALQKHQQAAWQDASWTEDRWQAAWKEDRWQAAWKEDASWKEDRQPWPDASWKEDRWHSRDASWQGESSQGARWHERKQGTGWHDWHAAPEPAQQSAAPNVRGGGSPGGSAHVPGKARPAPAKSKQGPQGPQKHEGGPKQPGYGPPEHLAQLGATARSLGLQLSTAAQKADSSDSSAAASKAASAVG